MEKNQSDFYKYKNGKLYSFCKKCHNQKSKLYNIKNKKSIKEYFKSYYKKNKEKMDINALEWRIQNKDYLIEYEKNRNISRSEYNSTKSKEYRKKNKERCREKGTAYKRLRRERDEDYKIIMNLRSRIYSALKRSQALKADSTVELLGCNLEDFKHHLQSKFKEGMTFNNYGRWHIDHIVPCSLFDLKNEYHQKLCFHYTNLQPLWACENLKKGSKL